MRALRGVDRRAVRCGVVFFFELSARGRELLRDVHRLARAYHWSERDILNLTLDRRLAYLLMLEADEDATLLSGLNQGDLG